MQTERASPPTPLVLNLFGPFAAFVHGAPLPRLRSRKGQWLLALLALRQGREVERAWLMELLWPGAATPQAAMSLRSSLRDLRQALGPEAGRLSSPTSRSLALDLTGAVVDVLAFDQALVRGNEAGLVEAVSLYRGPLLEGCAEEWVFEERLAREQGLLTALEALAAGAMERNDAAAAQAYLRRAVAVDPLGESAQRGLMAALAAGGNVAAALRTYRELRLHLHRELNSEPDPETTALFQQLRDRAGAGAIRPDAPEPALRVTPPPNNLPIQPTPLVGRAQEVSAAKELLQRDELRLVTLTGAGGIGKTRLALQIAAELRDGYRDGVFFIDLAPIFDPELVASTIAHTLGVPEQAGQSIRESLKQALRRRQMLLLLDNFEQVLEAASLVAELLAVSPGVKLLITSRAALRLRGEQEFPVPPLSLPDPERREPLDRLPRYPGVALFIQRALAMKPDFAVTSDNTPVLVEICRRLEGLPLAIELAAARSKLFSLPALLSRLEAPLTLLTGGARDLPARQQSLKHTIAWSYDLLSEEEQTLFRRLSVFVGGFTLEAAVAVGAGGGETEAEVLDTLASLVDKGLLCQREPAGGEARFAMLEMVREYGLERLKASGAEAEIRRKHAVFFSGLMERHEANRAVWDPRHQAQVEREQPNLRAALAWLLERGELETGMRLGGALAQFWYLQGHWTDGRERLEALLAHPRSFDYPSLRARIIIETVGVAHKQGDFTTAEGLLEEALRLGREQGDEGLIGWALMYLGWCAHQQGNTEQALVYHETNLAAGRALNDARRVINALHGIGCIALFRGDYAAAKGHFEEQRDLSRAVDHQEMLGIAQFHLGRTAILQGEIGHARALLEEALDLFRRLGLQWNIADALNRLGVVTWSEGNRQEAAELYRESLKLARKVAAPGTTAFNLEGLATCAAAEGKMPRAARLLAAAAALREAKRAPLHPSHGPALDVETVRAALGETRFQAAWREGQALALEDAIEEALAESD